MRRLLLYMLFMFVALPSFAQKYPERGLVRKGNRAFEKQLYEKSLASYEEALQYDSTNFVTRYNLGNALIFAERYDRAAELLSSAAADTTRMAEERAEAMFNLGNLHLSQQKLQEALDAYKGSLRFNPADEQAKFNYAYVKRLMEQNQQNQQNQDQNQDNQQNQDNKQQPENKPSEDNKDNQDQQNNDPQDSDGDNQNEESEPEQNEPEQNEQGEAPVESRISEQEQARMLDAIQAEEDKTQEKLKEKARGVIIKGRKNW